MGACASEEDDFSRATPVMPAARNGKPRSLDAGRSRKAGAGKQNGGKRASHEQDGEGEGGDEVEESGADDEDGDVPPGGNIGLIFERLEIEPDPEKTTEDLLFEIFPYCGPDDENDLFPHVDRFAERLIGGPETDFSLVDEDGNTMLFWALQARNVTMVELVLSKSKDIVKFKVSPVAWYFCFLSC